jgi:UDP-N-acetylmuramyl pentapeptide phosphotransferase/UDP-N-acetylglucosamine-1-phosphate transferase
MTGVNVEIMLLTAMWVVPAFAVSFFGTLGLRYWLPRIGLVDVANLRSSHVEPTPRSGGLSFVIVVLVLTALMVREQAAVVPRDILALLLGSMVVAGVSLVDDRWGLPVGFRLGAHTIGAIILIAGGAVVHELVLPGGFRWSLGVLSIPVTALWIVGLTNSYNFMDGIDGLAAGQAVIVSLAMAWLSSLKGPQTIAFPMLILGAAVFGFLLHNWPRAKIFMGDVGSAFLGFSLAGWAIVSASTPHSPLPLTAWVIPLAPFIFDTAVTLVLRVFRGKRWYEAHREHYYQRLVQRGWSHLAVTVWYLGLATFLSLITIAYYGYEIFTPPVFLLLGALPLILNVLLVRRVERGSQKTMTAQAQCQ